jgi:hypothetical protein
MEAQSIKKLPTPMKSALLAPAPSVGVPEGVGATGGLVVSSDGSDGSVGIGDGVGSVSGVGAVVGVSAREVGEPEGTEDVSKTFGVGVLG